MSLKSSSKPKTPVKLHIVVGNSESYVVGATAEQFRRIRDRLSQKTACYGPQRIDPSNKNRLIFSPKGVFFRDAKNKACLVFGNGRRIMTRQQVDRLLNARALTFKGNWFRIKYFLGKRGNFPTGLLYLLRGIPVVDKRIKPNFSVMFPVPRFVFEPNLDQIGAAKVCAEKHRGIVVAPTAFGKSAIVALICAALGVRTLVVVPSLELKRQLTESLSDAFGRRWVGPLSEQKAIAVENVAALSLTKPIKGYDAIIIDEFHHSAAKTYRTLNLHAWNGIYYRFGMTATPYRTNEDEKLLLESVLSEVIYRISYNNGLYMKRVAPLEAYYITLPEKDVEGYSYDEVYKELVVSNAVRNTLIANISLKLHSEGKSTLILVKQIEHGIALLQHIRGMGVPAEFANGEDDASTMHIKNFACGKLKTLLATSIVGEGCDTKAAEYVLLAGGTGKSRVQIMQNIGRVLRVYPGKDSGKVVTFKETSHRWFEEQHKLFVKICKEEYGVMPVEVC